MRVAEMNARSRHSKSQAARGQCQPDLSKKHQPPFCQRSAAFSRHSVNHGQQNDSSALLFETTVLRWNSILLSCRSPQGENSFPAESCSWATTEICCCSVFLENCKKSRIRTVLANRIPAKNCSPPTIEFGHQNCNLPASDESSSASGSATLRRT